MRNVQMPPSKSIAHRAMIASALSPGESILIPFPDSLDAEATLGCLTALGTECKRDKKGLSIKGGMKCRFESVVLDCGESGSTLRFMIPLALLLNQEIILTGKGRLFQRPHGPYLEALASKGAYIRQKKNSITVKGPIGSGTYELPGHISSQFVTGLLLVLPVIKGDSRIVITSPLQSKSYVDLTLKVMKDFGVSVKNLGYEQFIIPGNQSYSSRKYMIEGDFSGAAYFLAAGALGHAVECLGLNRDSLQGDRAIIDILKSCGSEVEFGQSGQIRACPGLLTGVTVSVEDIPDLVPPLAALFCFCKGESRIINAKRLRIKESDRLHALSLELNRLGANIEEREDGLKINGVKTLIGGEADAHNDHRIAMALALASLRSINPVIIKGADCVGKSYPGFFDDFFKGGKGGKNE